MVERKAVTIGDRGQITLPKQLRKAFGLSRGDEVTIREDGDKIIIEKPMARAKLVEGYRQRAQRHRAVAEEMGDVSREADAFLSEIPEWEK